MHSVGTSAVLLQSPFGVLLEGVRKEDAAEDYGQPPDDTSSDSDAYQHYDSQVNIATE